MEHVWGNDFDEMFDWIEGTEEQTKAYLDALDTPQTRVYATKENVDEIVLTPEVLERIARNW